MSKVSSIEDLSIRRLTFSYKMLTYRPFNGELLHVKRSWKLKWPKSALFHRNHCSWRAWNASWVVLPSVPWLCDITLCHCVRHLHHLAYISSRGRANWWLKTRHSQPETWWAGWLRRVWVDRSEQTLYSAGGQPEHSHNVSPLSLIIINLEKEPHQPTFRETI